MGDNVDVTEGAGKTVASDDIQVDATHAQGQVQFVKLVDGTLNGTGSIRVNQAAKAHALTVAPASDITDGTYIGDIKFGEAVYTEDVATPATIVGLATVMERDDVLGGLTPAEGDWASLRCDANGALWVHDNVVNTLLTTIDSDTGNMLTALQLIDNAVDGNYLNCNLNIAGTDCVGNSGVLAAGVLRVTIATDDEVNNLLGTIDTDTGNMVTALQLIDNAVDGNYLNVNLNIAGTDCVGGSGAQDAQTLRVILATDDPAVAHLNNILTALQIMDDWDESDRAKVNPIAGQVGVQGAEGTITALTQRVTLATDDDGVVHLATIAGDTTGIETAVEIMDDWDATHDSAVSADGPQVMAAYDATKPAVVEDGDAVRILADQYGRLLAGVEPTRWQEDYDSVDASGEGEAIKASAASTILVVQSYIISSDAEIWVKLQEENSAALTGKFWLKAGGGVAITLPDKAPLVLGVDSDLEVITEGAGAVSVSVTGYTIPG